MGRETRLRLRQRVDAACWVEMELAWNGRDESGGMNTIVGVASVDSIWDGGFEL